MSAGKRILLRHMARDQAGTVTAVKVGGDLGLRIREMGIVPGARIRVRGRAPLYDPVAVKVMGTVVSLRNNEADHIEVEVDDA